MTKRKLSLEEIAKILCHSVETIKRYAKKGELPKIESDGESLVFSEEEIAKKFNLKNLNEPFIDIKKAEEITGLNKKLIHYLHTLKSEDPIPHYKLKDYKNKKWSKKGAVKLLFLKSELKEWMNPKMIVSSKYSNYRYKNELFKEIISSAININEKLGFLSSQEKFVFEKIFLDGKKLSEFASERGLSEFQFRYTFKKAYKKIKQNFENLPKLMEENKKYSEKIKLLEEKVKMLEKGINTSNMKEEILSIYAISLEDLDLSVRARNCLICMDVKTLGDLMTPKYSERNLLKFRNVGQKTAEEIKSVVKKYGLELKY